MPRRTRQILLGCGAVGLLVAAGVFLAFRSKLPADWSAAKERVAGAIGYCRGWIDAAFDASRDRYSYAFLNPVVGLDDYARLHDGIGSIRHDRRDVAYIAGFNARMSRNLRARFGSDFPTGYVQRYLASGWLELAQNQPATCPVHRVRMVITVVPIEDISVALPPLGSSGAVAVKRFFPYPASSQRLETSFLPRPGQARIRACPACTFAEQQWIAAQGRSWSR